MVKFIKSIFVFAFFCVFFYAFLLYTWGRVAPNLFKKNLHFDNSSSTSFRLDEVKGVNNIDILFLGSSHAYRGFDTRIFENKGYKSFNLGSIGQTPIQTEYLVGLYLDSLKPKKIIYEVYPECFESDGVESTLDLVNVSDLDSKMIEMTRKSMNIKVFNSLSFRLLNGKEPSKLYALDTYIKGGFVERKMTFFKDDGGLKKHKLVLNDNQLRAFERIVEVVKQKGSALYLVQTPISKASYQCYLNIAEFDSYMASKGHYTNFNPICNFNDLMFYDFHHLNQNGVEAFNKIVIEHLF